MRAKSKLPKFDADQLAQVIGQLGEQQAAMDEMAAKVAKTSVDLESELGRLVSARQRKREPKAKQKPAPKSVPQDPRNAAAPDYVRATDMRRYNSELSEGFRNTMASIESLIAEIRANNVKLPEKTMEPLQVKVLSRDEDGNIKTVRLEQLRPIH